mmetsp:Transcript_37426/g.69142  ORF Transcript_37426/g.69142 Transcript_37426/m.69142 type:complete len:206 (-) Transcript_37426:406-1023(-)
MRLIKRTLALTCADFHSARKQFFYCLSVTRTPKFDQTFWGLFRLASIPILRSMALNRLRKDTWAMPSSPTFPMTLFSPSSVNSAPKSTACGLLKSSMPHTAFSTDGRFTSAKTPAEGFTGVSFSKATTLPTCAFLNGAKLERSYDAPKKPLYPPFASARMSQPICTPATLASANISIDLSLNIFRRVVVRMPPRARLYMPPIDRL